MMILDQEGKASISSKQNRTWKCWRQGQGVQEPKQEGVFGGLAGNEPGGRQGPDDGL